MSRRKKRQGHGPRGHRLRRPARLASARDWMASGARVIIRTYAKWFGLDRYTAYDELTMVSAGGHVAPLAFPEVALAVDDILMR